MEIKTKDTTEADQISAKTLFDALKTLRSLYWGTGNVTALDAFARNGQLTVSAYSEWVDSFDCWELSPEHERDLLKLGAMDVRIGCSYAQAQVSDQRYNLVVIDTPQGVHRSADGFDRVEHFKFLDMVYSRLIGTRAVIVLYVNREPYNRNVVGEHGYDKYEEYDFDRWMEARKKFYGMAKITESLAMDAYRDQAEKHGFELRLPLIVPCLSDVPGRAPYAFRLAFLADKT